MKEFKLYNNTETIYFDDSPGKNGKPKHAYWRLDPDDLKKDGTPKKKRIVGVTTVLNVINKPALIPWAVGVTVDYLKNNLDRIQDDPRKLLEDAKQESEKQKREAGDLGNLIHDWIEQHIKGEKPEMPDEENVKRGVISFLDWERENKVEYLESEKLVYSKKYNYVGRLDIIAKVNGKLYLVDLKTGNAIWQEHHAQVAAYLKADTEERGTKYDGRIVLRVAKETEVEFQERMKDKTYYINNPEKYPYLPFEAIYLDEEEQKIHQDFKAFESALNIYRWKK